MACHFSHLLCANWADSMSTQPCSPYPQPLCIVHMGSQPKNKMISLSAKAQPSLEGEEEEASPLDRRTKAAGRGSPTQR